LFKKYKKKILLSVSFGALVFLCFSIYADFSNLMISFSRFDWKWLPVILLCSFGNYIIRFFKWQYYLKILNIKIRPWRSAVIFFSSFIMSVTPGKMGEVLKSFLLKEETGTSLSVSTPIILAERITDFLSIVILCLAGAIVFDYGTNIIIVVGLFFLFFTILLSYRKFCFYTIDILSKFKFIKKHSGKIHTAYESTYNLIKIKPLLLIVGLSTIAWFLECLGFFLVLNVFSSVSNVDVSILKATFIYGFSTLIGAIAMLPGGLGATEASLTGLLVLLKIPKDISVASTIIIRVATLWFAVILGMIAVQFYQKIFHKGISEIE